MIVTLTVSVWAILLEHVLAYPASAKMQPATAGVLAALAADPKTAAPAISVIMVNALNI